MEALTAGWTTSTLSAAIDLDLFTALGRRSRSAADLSARCGADRPHLERLCDALVSFGWLTKDRGRYRAPSDAARLLDAHSPDAMAGVSRFFTGPEVAAAFARLSRTIRRGGRSARVSPRARLWRDFAEATLALRRWVAAQAADDLQQRGLGTGRILDVGAGASPLGIELLRREPTASLVVQDRAGVADVAQHHARRAGVIARVSIRAGDALHVRWGGAFDLVLLVNVLEYFTPRQQALLARKAYAALRPGGTLAVMAPLLNASRTSPPEGVAYDLLLLALGAHGRAQTLAELKQLLGAARFSPVTRCAGGSLVLARRRRA